MKKVWMCCVVWRLCENYPFEPHSISKFRVSINYYQHDFRNLQSKDKEKGPAAHQTAGPFRGQ
jgi:hypothetical protein